MAHYEKHERQNQCFAFVALLIHLKWNHKRQLSHFLMGKGVWLQICKEGRSIVLKYYILINANLCSDDNPKTRAKDPRSYSLNQEQQMLHGGLRPP